MKFGGDARISERMETHTNNLSEEFAKKLNKVCKWVFYSYRNGIKKNIITITSMSTRTNIVII